MKARKIKILITAGPTREYLDPVRFISNDSSGKMGFALAQAALELGAEITLVAGPVALPTPKGARRIDVVSCEDMRKATLAHAKNADIIIMAAAVADAKPARYSKTKLKKPLKPVALTPTPDILAELGCTKRADQTLVGFALETNDLIGNARKKLLDKRCDWIVANSPSSLGSDLSKATLIPANDKPIGLPSLPKHDVAVLILSYVLS